VGRMVGFCGTVCSDCRAFIATKEDDDVLRRVAAEVWSEASGEDIKPEDVNCDGCLTVDGRVFGHCLVCEIRRCGFGRRVANCAFCVDYACEKLARYFAENVKARGSLEEIRRELGKQGF